MTRRKRLKLNIVLYRLLLVAGKNGLTISAIYFFFTLTKGFSPSQALLLIGLTSLVKALFEVPTGIVSDRFSRKYSILIGNLIILMSLLGIILTPNFLITAIFTSLKGVGGSFRSGSDDALLFDSLDELGIAKKFKRTLNTSQGIELVFFAITLLLGGFLASINLYLPIWGHIVFITFSVVFSFLLTEPEITRKGKEIAHIGYLPHLTKSVATIFSKSGLINGLLISFTSLAIITAVFKSTKNILSPVLNQYDVGVFEIGAILAVMMIIKALGAFIASRISVNGKEIKEVLIGLSILILGLVGVVLIQPVILKLVIFLVTLMFDNVVVANLSTLINNKIPNSQRATILSIQSLFARSSETFYLTSFGWLIASKGFELSMVYTIAWLCVALLLVSVWAFYSNSKKSEHYLKINAMMLSKLVH